MPKVKINSGEEIALTKATIRAADRLDISQKLLAEIIGLSEATLSRMRTGAFVLDRVNGKPFELAVLFVEMFELLEQLVLGDETTARAWLVGENKLLGGRPTDLIRSVRGLADVVGYLRVRS